jgi:hypothetical protein
MIENKKSNNKEDLLINKNKSLKNNFKLFFIGLLIFLITYSFLFIILFNYIYNLNIIFFNIISFILFSFLFIILFKPYLFYIIKFLIFFSIIFISIIFYKIINVYFSLFLLTVFIWQFKNINNFLKNILKFLL